MGTVGALLGLMVGMLLAFAGSEALTRAIRSLLPAALAGVAAFLAVLSSAAPEYLFAMRASWLELGGAAIGAVAGSFVANAFVAATAAATGAIDEARGGRTFATLSAIAAAALLVAAFDGQVTRFEGGLLLAGALLAAIRATRLDLRSREDDAPRLSFPLALFMAPLGVALLLFGTWLALYELAAWSAGYSDGDLLAGLIMLGAGAALPEIAAAIIAARKGAGARGFVNVAVGTSLTLFGAIGAAALVRPISVPEAFLGVPAMILALAAATLFAVAAFKRRLPRGAVVLGLIAWGGSLAAFAWSVG